jgi:hypothetical protein
MRVFRAILAAATVAITLAPTMPPGVQYLEVRAMEPGEEAQAPLTCESR